MSATSNAPTKADGAGFWNSNPCGGEWPNPATFVAWYMATEPYIFRLLAEHDWTDRRVLEVGCGQGVVMAFLARRGAAVHGIDMSAASVRRALYTAAALGLADRVQAELGDAEQLAAADGSYPRVVSIGVLHHSPDTDRGVQEIHRVLSPGGTAVVMLYRSGNPKWWATWSIRAASHLIDRVYGRPQVIASRLRARQAQGAVVGTALLELFGCPVLQAFSNRQAQRMFAGFSKVKITNHVPGFERLIDVLPSLRVVRPALRLIDRVTCHWWGFYQVIEAVK